MHTLTVDQDQLHDNSLKRFTHEKLYLSDCSLFLYDVFKSNMLFDFSFSCVYIKCYLRHTFGILAYILMVMTDICLGFEYVWWKLLKMRYVTKLMCFLNDLNEYEIIDWCSNGKIFIYSRRTPSCSFSCSCDSPDLIPYNLHNWFFEILTSVNNFYFYLCFQHVGWRLFQIYVSPILNSVVSFF